MDVTLFSISDVVVATLVGMMLGAFWYSPVVFGAAWMASIGKTADTLGSQTLPMIGSVVASLLTAVGVTLLSNGLGVSSLGEAIVLGAVLGVLIIFPALLSDNLFCGWGSKLLMIQAGYRLLAVMLMSLAVYWV